MSTLLDIFVLVDSSIPFEGVIRDNSLVFIFCDVTDFFADYHGMYDLVDRARRKLFSGFSADVITLIHWPPKDTSEFRHTWLQQLIDDRSGGHPCTETSS